MAVDGSRLEIFAEVFSGFLGPAPFILKINDLFGDVLCNIVIYAHYATLYCRCD